ncbi:acyl-CoA dehydrogenase [Salinarimonas ramus]|uniref:3-methylmercaptopropionyl-CoA dehydrogenase n=1 Tax=Salinarimonas ramus TaxID=690164 RepID=A0A917Q5T7_9HYPH|nr:acyl-CoA dehydrogenase [Salinarimonas ramus]GGK27580.1 acyl-CoA dehydrogenase [Salinarimonas ramus]
MAYRAPVSQMLFSMRAVAGLDAAIEGGLYPDLTTQLVAQILEAAGDFAAERLEPLNRPGDLAGLRKDGAAVRTPDGFPKAYQDWISGGWNALPGPVEHGGQGLPILVNTACVEMWNAANMAFALCPILTMGAIDAIEAHASPDLKERYLEKLVSGEWTATMNLTEPQAGSDLSALRTRAERADDGTYRIFGQKIYITFGEHDLTDNIVHLVLARLPDAPHGTRGISLFLVPKILPDGSRNDVVCAGLEHKLGIHAAPTCTMSYGEAGGAVGWLVGEENRGLACMFTMMNNARLAVGVQGVAMAERATQRALDYARERRQGRTVAYTGQGMVAIAEHADVRRMLSSMRGLTEAARGICFLTAASLDAAGRAGDVEARKAAFERASLLTPLAKAFSTDIAVEVASLGVQVHGGMGFVEETGAAQYYRDARILPIYEGTNGIQAIDLVTRKLPLSGGATVRAEIARIRASATRVTKEADERFGALGPRLREATMRLDEATAWMLAALAEGRQDDVLAGATPYLRLFAMTRGVACLADEALAAKAALAAGETDPAHEARIARARYMAEAHLGETEGLARSATAGAAALPAADALAV